MRREKSVPFVLSPLSSLASSPHSHRSQKTNSLTESIYVCLAFYNLLTCVSVLYGRIHIRGKFCSCIFYFAACFLCCTTCAHYACRGVCYSFLSSNSIRQLTLPQIGLRMQPDTFSLFTFTSIDIVNANFLVAHVTTQSSPLSLSRSQDTLNFSSYNLLLVCLAVDWSLLSNLNDKHRAGREVKRERASEWDKVKGVLFHGSSLSLSAGWNLRAQLCPMRNRAEAALTLSLIHLHTGSSVKWKRSQGGNKWEPREEAEFCEK